MSDIEHLPVRPNINNSIEALTKQTRHKSSSIPMQENSDLFYDNKDPDIQKYITKRKTDALELDSVATKEEKSSKENYKPDTGFSWVIIALTVVIVILIMIIVYYVLKYNEISQNAVVIPANAVKPSVAMLPSSNVLTAIAVQQVPTSKKELDSVINRLAVIEEVSEPDEELPSSNITEVEEPSILNTETENFILDKKESDLEDMFSEMEADINDDFIAST